MSYRRTERQTSKSLQHLSSQNISCWENKLKLHLEKNFESYKNRSCNTVKYLVRKSVLKRNAFVFTTSKDRKWEIYIKSKFSSLIDQIKIRSQHPQDFARRCDNKCMNELLPHEEITCFIVTWLTITTLTQFRFKFVKYDDSDSKSNNITYLLYNIICLEARFLWLSRSERCQNDININVDDKMHLIEWFSSHMILITWSCSY